MSFECPERPLTEDEWTILSDAAQDKAGDYRMISEALAQQKYMKQADYYARKANEISDVLMKLEHEYYKAHPDEDPDERGGKK